MLVDLGALGISPQQIIQPLKLAHNPRRVHPGRRERRCLLDRHPLSPVSLERRLDRPQLGPYGRRVTPGREKADQVAGLRLETLDLALEFGRPNSSGLVGGAYKFFRLASVRSQLVALRDPAERAALGAILQRFPMKPKLDWIHAKVSNLQNQRLPGLPENAALMVTAVYDFLRTQRNDLGHPRDSPPAVDREDAFVNLQMFPRYYQIAEELRQFLAANQV